MEESVLSYRPSEVKLQGFRTAFIFFIFVLHVQSKIMISIWDKLLMITVIIITN